jgi:hypothetical protein
MSHQDFLHLIEFNLKNGTHKQKRIALELLMRFLEGKL